MADTGQNMSYIILYKYYWIYWQIQLDIKITTTNIIIHSLLMLTMIYYKCIVHFYIVIIIVVILIIMINFMIIHRMRAVGPAGRTGQWVEVKFQFSSIPPELLDHSHRYLDHSHHYFDHSHHLILITISFIYTINIVDAWWWFWSKQALCTQVSVEPGQSQRIDPFL